MRALLAGMLLAAGYSVATRAASGEVGGAGHGRPFLTTEHGVTGVVPWVIPALSLESAKPGDRLTLHYDANLDPSTITPWTITPFQVDGFSSSEYETGVASGSTALLCAHGSSECSEESSKCDGAICLTKLGNMTGATSEGIRFRVQHTPAGCDDFAGATIGGSGRGYFPSRACDTESAIASRIAIVAVGERICAPSCFHVRLTGFARIWIEGYAAGACSGNECDVDVRLMEYPD